MSIQQQIDAQLENLKLLPHLRYSHPPFSSCEISAAFHHDHPIEGLRTKNLFLRNKSGKRHFLLVLPPEKNFDPSAFREQTGQKCGLASDERLWQYLGVKPGCVSALALVVDTDRAVEVYLDEDLLNADFWHLHPGINTESLSLTPNEVLAYIKSLGYEVQLIRW